VRDTPSRALLPRAGRRFDDRLVLVLVALLAAVLGCSSSTSDPAEPTDSDETGRASSPSSSRDRDTPSAEQDQPYPDVVAATLTSDGAGSYSVEVTISSPYDTPERYADGWRVLTLDGEELGSHTLLHDHASEQPFTRTQSGLLVPDGIDEVLVEGRDLVNGYGGQTRRVEVPRPQG
jgi:hypothetical protein